MVLSAVFGTALRSNAHPICRCRVIGTDQYIIYSSAKAGQDIGLLYLVIAADNLSVGWPGCFCCLFIELDQYFTAAMHAIFSSIMTLFPKVLGGYSGSIVEGIGYESFFLITALGPASAIFDFWVNRLLIARQSG